MEIEGTRRFESRTARSAEDKKESRQLDPAVSRDGEQIEGSWVGSGSYSTMVHQWICNVRHSVFKMIFITADGKVALNTLMDEVDLLKKEGEYKIMTKIRNLNLYT